MAGPAGIARSNHTCAVLAVLLWMVFLAGCGQRNVVRSDPTMPLRVLLCGRYEQPIQSAWEHIMDQDGIVPGLFAISLGLAWAIRMFRRPTAPVIRVASERFEGAGLRFLANAKLTTPYALASNRIA